MERTQGEWKIKDFGDRLVIVPKDESTIITAISKIDETSAANAAFIAKACNCHDDLLKACKGARPYLKDSSCPSARYFSLILEKAIAKAEE